MTRLTLLILLLVYLAAPINAQQILITRTFDNPVQRIAVLLRAADLLWPHDQEKSLVAFMEAFELAVQNFKEKGDQTERASSSRVSAVIQLPDQRFTVISALAKRHPARARKLSEQMLQDDARDVAGKSEPEERRKHENRNHRLHGFKSGIFIRVICG